MLTKALTHRRSTLPVAAETWSPFNLFQRDLNRLFGDFFGEEGLPALAPSKFLPSVDVTETEKEFRILAELPGMSEEDVQVSLDHNVLTLSGEKKETKESQAGNVHHMERSYGSFQRTFTLPVEVRADKVDASFKNGVLTVVLPKAEPSETRKIQVKKG